MWKPGADVRCLPQSLSMTQALSPLSGGHCFGWPGWPGWPESPMGPPTQCWDYRGTPLLYGCWEWNSGPSTLLSESSPKSLGLEFNSIN